MLRAIDTILESVPDVAREELLADKLRYYGVVYNTMIIGEAAYKLSPSFVEHFPQVDWQIIADMRHHLVHGYYQVKVDDILDVIKQDLQPLREQVITLLNNVDWNDWETRK